MSEWAMSFDDELEKLGYRVGWLHSDVYNVYDPRGNVIGVEKNIRDARTKAYNHHQMKQVSVPKSQSHYLISYEDYGKDPKHIAVVHSWQEACEVIRQRLDVAALDESAWEKGDGVTEYVLGDAAYVVRWIP